MAYVLVRR